MFTATLIADPARAGLDRATVESLRNAWGGGEARWLNPGTAAEFPLPAMPANRWDVWQSLQSLGFDLVLQPTANRRKRLLIADMDSTMIRQECIDELAAEAGVGAACRRDHRPRDERRARFRGGPDRARRAAQGSGRRRHRQGAGRTHHHDARRSDACRHDEGERGIYRPRLRRLHCLHRSRRRAPGVRRTPRQHPAGDETAA